MYPTRPTITVEPETKETLDKSRLDVLVLKWANQTQSSPRTPTTTKNWPILMAKALSQFYDSANYKALLFTEFPTNGDHRPIV